MCCRLDTCRLGRAIVRHTIIDADRARHQRFCLFFRQSAYNLYERASRGREPTNQPNAWKVLTCRGLKSLALVLDHKGPRHVGAVLRARESARLQAPIDLRRRPRKVGSSPLHPCTLYLGPGPPNCDTMLRALLLLVAVTASATLRVGPTSVVQPARATRVRPAGLSRRALVFSLPAASVFGGGGALLPTIAEAASSPEEMALLAFVKYFNTYTAKNDEKGLTKALEKALAKDSKKNCLVVESPLASTFKPGAKVDYYGPYLAYGPSAIAPELAQVALDPTSLKGKHEVVSAIQVVAQKDGPTYAFADCVSKVERGGEYPYHLSLVLDEKDPSKVSFFGFVDGPDRFKKFEELVLPSMKKPYDPKDLGAGAES